LVLRCHEKVADTLKPDACVIRGMLAERLLAKSDFDTDTEVRTLEHLKKRFGENNLHSCEVKHS